LRGALADPWQCYLSPLVNQVIGFGFLELYIGGDTIAVYNATRNTELIVAAISQQTGEWQNGPPDHRTTGPPDHRTTGPPDHRTTGPPDHRTTGPPVIFRASKLFGMRLRMRGNGLHLFTHGISYTLIRIKVFTLRPLRPCASAFDLMSTTSPPRSRSSSQRLCVKKKQTHPMIRQRLLLEKVGFWLHRAAWYLIRYTLKRRMARMGYNAQRVAFDFDVIRLVDYKNNVCMECAYEDLRVIRHLIYEEETSRSLSQAPEFLSGELAKKPNAMQKYANVLIKGMDKLRRQQDSITHQTQILLNEAKAQLRAARSTNQVSNNAGNAHAKQLTHP
jgi:hypothetical protein